MIRTAFFLFLSGIVLIVHAQYSLGCRSDPDEKMCYHDDNCAWCPFQKSSREDTGECVPYDDCSPVDCEGMIISETYDTCKEEKQDTHFQMNILYGIGSCILLLCAICCTGYLLVQCMRIRRDCDKSVYTHI